jgi:tetratricopeptide (TPR) repeat protein
MRVKISVAWMSSASIALLATVALAQVQHPEAMSLLGRQLFTERPKGDAAVKAEQDIERARAAFEKDPANPDAAYALGQADEAGGRLLDAIDAYTLAIEKHPDDQRLLFARGRLLILIRKFDIALRDLRSTAASAIPEARCRAAFATYLKGEFGNARDAFKKDCPASPWGAVAAARADRSPPPQPPSDDELVRSYYSALGPLITKDTPHARDQLKKIVDKQSKRWTDDAYIAAEADLARLPKSRGKHTKKSLESN